MRRSEVRVEMGRSEQLGTVVDNPTAGRRLDCARGSGKPQRGDWRGIGAEQSPVNQKLARFFGVVVEPCARRSQAEAITSGIHVDARTIESKPDDLIG